MSNLLPSDRWLARQLGWTEAQMEQFIADASAAAAAQPPPRVVAGTGLEVIAINLLISAALTVGASIISGLLRPTPGSPGTVETTQQEGLSKNSSGRFAQTSSFDASQEVATLGQAIPLVYGLRENLAALNGRPAGLYGGIRADLNLIWSQMVALKTAQGFRGIYLLSEGPVTGLDPRNFAIGSTPLEVFDLGSAPANEQSSQFSVYFRGNGGRIVSADRVAGRLGANDPLNAQNDGAADVFRVRSVGNAYAPDFSSSARPSSAGVFGIYGVIGNNLGYRVNARLRPTRTFRTRPTGDDGDQIVDPEDDPTALGSFWKSAYPWSGRWGIITAAGVGGGGVTVTVAAGDTIVYRLDKSTDADTRLVFNSSNTDTTTDHTERNEDVANSVAARQRAAAEALVIGELYRAGSCLARLESQSHPVFASDADQEPLGAGQTVDYTFRVVRGGNVVTTSTTEINPTSTGTQIFPPRAGGGQNWEYEGLAGYSPAGTATNRAQIFRCAIADVAISRPARIIEVGLRCTLGVRVNGLCNFRDSLRQKEINRRAGGERGGQVLASGSKFNVQVFQSGQISRSEIRYSFWRLFYRKAGDTSFTASAQLFGARSQTQQANTHSMWLEMPTSDVWEYRFEPVSGWEIRSNTAAGDLCVLDAGNPTLRTVTTGSVTIRYRGEAPITSRTQSAWDMGKLEPAATAPGFNPSNLGLGWTDTNTNSMIDSWARLAESFAYEELQTTAAQGPEWEVAFLNTIAVNAAAPLYNNLAIVGLNIRSSAGLSQLNQFSGYVTAGQSVRRLLQTDTEGPTHLFPDILRDRLLNTRWGDGNSFVESQIDVASFVAAAQWNQDRRYFMDVRIPQPQNIRQWASEIAPLFLLAYGEANGKCYLAKAIDFAPVTADALLTPGNIEIETFTTNWRPAEDRRPIQVSVKWREERESTNLAAPGLFPVTRELLVREVGVADTAPIRSIDMSPFCTNEAHAIDAAKFLIRYTSLVDHDIEFETTYALEIGAIRPDGYIRVAMPGTYYSGYRNGAVTSGGTLFSNVPLANGSYNVIAWDGNPATPSAPTTLTVSGGGTTASPTGIAFTVPVEADQTRWYRVQSVSPLPDGRFSVTAQHWPCDLSGNMAIVTNWDDAGSWVIQR
jgi:hypothetical protein